MNTREIGPVGTALRVVGGAGPLYLAGCVFLLSADEVETRWTGSNRHVQRSS